MLAAAAADDRCLSPNGTVTLRILGKMMILWSLRHCETPMANVIFSFNFLHPTPELTSTSALMTAGDKRVRPAIGCALTEAQLQQANPAFPEPTKSLPWNDFPQRLI